MVKKPTPLDTGDIILAICPSKGCFETIAAMVSNALWANIMKRKALIDANGHDAKGVGQLELKICLQITHEHEKEALRHHAIANGWPTLIEFASLPQHISKTDLQGELAALLLMSTEMGTNNIFCNLIDDLVELGQGKTKEEALAQFSTLSSPSIPRIILEKARPG